MKVKLVIEFTEYKNVMPVLQVLQEKGIKWASGHLATTLAGYFYSAPGELDPYQTHLGIIASTPPFMCCIQYYELEGAKNIITDKEFLKQQSEIIIVNKEGVK